MEEKLIQRIVFVFDYLGKSRPLQKRSPGNIFILSHRLCRKLFRFLHHKIQNPLLPHGHNFLSRQIYINLLFPLRRIDQIPIPFHQCCGGTLLLRQNVAAVKVIVLHHGKPLAHGIQITEPYLLQHDLHRLPAQNLSLLIRRHRKLCDLYLVHIHFERIPVQNRKKNPFFSQIHRGIFR